MFKYLHIIIEFTGFKEIFEIPSLGLHIMKPKHKGNTPE